MRIYAVSLLITLFILHFSRAQDIQLFQQFNGQFDYTAIGNTLNPSENNRDRTFCEPLESSSAQLILPDDITVQKAYLYWAGSGLGDTNVKLNGLSINADDVYTVDYQATVVSDTLTFFSCYSDITDIVASNGNTEYELSDLDISEDLAEFSGFCEDRTNFAGWSIYIIYENSELPLNQINLYQGLDIINRNNQEIAIEINNLNVIDSEGAKIGFLAWEGDDSLNFGESLSINGNVLSNPPLNLSDNAFNGTNTFTNSADFYNADLDVYNIQENISIGDTSAIITMTTGGFTEDNQFAADLIIINNIITVLNSQLPDATIVVTEAQLNCITNEVLLEYQVFNTNSTKILPSNTPIAFYISDELIASSETENDILINGMEAGAISITLPENIDGNFLLTASIDDDGLGNGTVLETNESNNISTIQLEAINAKPLQTLEGSKACNQGFESATFDLTEVIGEQLNDNVQVEFYESLVDLDNETFKIINPFNYQLLNNPQTLFARVESFPCFKTYTFELSIENCPPRVPQGFSPNWDGTNDWFNIQGLYDIFENHRLKIFNRYGTLIFQGNNNERWEGLINRGINNRGNLVPVGTYFYSIELNDSDYEPLFGYIYVNY